MEHTYVLAVPEYVEDWFGNDRLASEVRYLFYSTTPPDNCFAANHPFRSPEGRKGNGYITTSDPEQQMAWQALNDDVYNAYLIHRGCVIPLFEEVAAFKAYMKTYGVGKPPNFSRPLQRNGGEATFGPHGRTDLSMVPRVAITTWPL